MKRWVIAVALVATVLIGLASVAWADPTNVGGGFSGLTSDSSSLVYVVKGNPHVAFAPTIELTSSLDPTNVGGG